MIQRKSLAQEVADLIQHDIRSGVYALNAKLPTEPELMKHYGVGRSSVREAIKYLERSGYLNVMQGIGTWIISTGGHESLENTLQQANLSDWYEVRQLLETKITQKAALNRKEEHLQKLETVLQKRRQFAQEGRLEETVKADVAFHLIIAESCGNHLLYEIYKAISVHLSQFFADQYADTGIFVRSQKLHEELYDQIKAQNPVKTLNLINQIINSD